MPDKKVLLREDDIPSEWYNIIPDLPFDLPPATSPTTGYPIGPHDLADLFPRELANQELDREHRAIRIPDPVRELYRLWRPTPLFRAKRFEEALDTPARIYYKYEGTSPSGSHELNTAVPQAFYCKQEGVKRMTTGTGAGEWGIALAIACKFFQVKCKVHMVRLSYERKPYGRIMMDIWGAEVAPSPARPSASGKKEGSAPSVSETSLGVAISEAASEAMGDADTKYALGSVLNHVVLHQTVIGLEARKQMDMVKQYPDIVIGCVGGGSNFAGLAFPFIRDSLKKKRSRFIAAEPAEVPSLTGGTYSYDYPDAAAVMPMLKMHTLGHDFVPPPIRAAAMRYHGMSPVVSALYDHEVMEAVAYPQEDVLDAAVLFSHSEGIVPAPESAYAIKAAVEEALRCKSAKESKVILFALNAHGYFDLEAYQEHLARRKA